MLHRPRRTRLLQLRRPLLLLLLLLLLELLLQLQLLLVQELLRQRVLVLQLRIPVLLLLLLLLQRERDAHALLVECVLHELQLRGELLQRMLRIAQTRLRLRQACHARRTELRQVIVEHLQLLRDGARHAHGYSLLEQLLRRRRREGQLRGRLLLLLLLQLLLLLLEQNELQLLHFKRRKRHPRHRVGRHS